MAGRPRINEEVDKEMKLEELVKTACDLLALLMMIENQICLLENP